MRSTPTCCTPSTRTPRACRPGSSPAGWRHCPAPRWSSAAAGSSSNSDHLRTLLMYEPRGHSAMSGAILQPPTRPDADWGVLYIEVSGCLPMCGHGTIGVATVLVETGMVEVTEPVTTIRLDTPGRARRRRGRRRRRRGQRRSRFATCRRTPTRWTRRSRYPASGRSATTSRTAATSTRWSTSTTSACRSTGPTQAARCWTPGWQSWTRSTSRTARCTRQRPRHQRMPPRPARSLPARTPGTRATRWRSTRAGSTGRPCGTGTSARMAQLHARGELALDIDFVNESFIGTPLHRPAGRKRPGRQRRRRSGADHHRARLADRHGPVHAGSGRPVPGGLPALT